MTATVAFALPLDTTALTTRVRALERQYGGHLGVMAKNLRTGEVFRYNASDRYATASVIKFPVMVAYFDQVHQGRLQPGMRITLTEQDKRPGSGILQMLEAGDAFTLIDAIRLMIVLSDNAATNIVLDRFATEHLEKLAVVNDLMTRLGLKNTRLLNRVFAYETKQNTGEAIRFGLGVSSPEDMVALLESLYRRTLIDSASSDAMLAILKQQFYEDMMPRFLPSEECEYLSVAHKTGFVNESKGDVGLILSDKADIALALFVDKHGDHGGGINNTAFLLGAEVSRAVWDAMVGSSAGVLPPARRVSVDWNSIPGGQWAIYRSSAAPFPHPARAEGFTRNDGTHYGWHPHYADSSIIVFVPTGFRASSAGSKLIIHFHGHMNDNLGVLEQFSLPQMMVAQRLNALLVIPQGPYKARDSFGGKMEDDGGFRRLVEDVMATMVQEKIVSTPRVDKIIIAAHSGGYRPAAFCVNRGGLTENVDRLFLFDAFYGQLNYFKEWLLNGTGQIYAAYTEHLKEEHTGFADEVREKAGDRFHVTPATVGHNEVVEAFFPLWAKELPDEWKLPEFIK